MPAFHPFTNVQSTNYWSAATGAVNPTLAWLVDFSDGNVNLFNQSNTNHAWCVRGGMNADAY